MGKLIFLDIDGTVRDFGGIIPDSAVRAIRKARAAGHAVCVCTGRPYGLVEKRILDIGFDGVVSGAGTYVVLDGTCIEHRYFPAEVLREMCGYFRQRDCYFEMYTFDRRFLLETCRDRYKRHIEAMGEHFRMPERASGEPYEIRREMSGAEKIEKVIYYSDELESGKVKADWEGKAAAVDFSGPTPYRYGCEIAPPGVNKKTGMQAIERVRGCSREDIVAVGDGENDMDMIAYAGVGVVMGNGIDSLKEIADLVTDTVLNDGVEKAFLELGLIS